MSTLPHEREKIVLDDIIDDCLKGRDKSVIVVTPVYEQARWLAREAHIISKSLKPLDAKRIKIYREAIEFDNGAYIKFISYHTPDQLRGLQVDRIVLMGEWGEFWQLLALLISKGATVEGVG